MRLLSRCQMQEGGDSGNTIMVWAPPHHSTLSLCQPFAQAPYEMSASWLIPFFYTEWIVINASFPILCWAWFPREETTALRPKWSHRLPPWLLGQKHTHLTKGLFWLSVSRVFGLAWVKKKHLGSNYRSIVAINKAVTFTSLSSNSINYLQEEGGAGREGKVDIISSLWHSQQAGSETQHKHNTKAQNPLTRSVLITHKGQLVVLMVVLPK